MYPVSVVGSKTTHAIRHLANSFTAEAVFQDSAVNTSTEMDDRLLDEHPAAMTGRLFTTSPP